MNPELIMNPDEVSELENHQETMIVDESGSITTKFQPGSREFAEVTDVHIVDELYA